MTEDRIVIKDLLVRGILGVNDWEREEKQDLLINLELFLDLAPCGASDDLKDSVNYRTLTKQVIGHVEESSRFTVETLCTDLAKICLEDGRVHRVRVRVEKPGALRFARSVGAEIERTRKDFD